MIHHAGRNADMKNLALPYQIVKAAHDLSSMRLMIETTGCMRIPERIPPRKAQGVRLAKRRRFPVNIFHGSQKVQYEAYALWYSLRPQTLEGPQATRAWNRLWWLHATTSAGSARGRELDKVRVARSRQSIGQIGQCSAASVAFLTSVAT